MASVNSTSSRLKEFTNDLNRVTAEFHTVEGELKAGKGSFGRLNQLQARFDELTVKIDGMMDKIRSGQGHRRATTRKPAAQRGTSRHDPRVSRTDEGLANQPEKFVTFKIF